jgi:hypothetical protein
MIDDHRTHEGIIMYYVENKNNIVDGGFASRNGGHVTQDSMMTAVRLSWQIRSLNSSNGLTLLFSLPAQSSICIINRL